MRCVVAILASLLTLPMASGGPAKAAETVLLNNGGSVIGELLNPKEVPRKKYVVQTPDGARITLAPAQVDRVARIRPEIAEYDKLRPTYPDTVDGQWSLAQWCRDHRLNPQREIHLRRVIELDPDHAEARRLLGYGHINGEWVTPDEVMTRRGLVRYKGEWVTPQEKEIHENRQKLSSAQQEWFIKIKRWQGWFGTAREPQAIENLQAINDPAAAKALAAQLDKEPSPQRRRMYVDVLGTLDAPEASEALAKAVIGDQDEEVRLSCLDWLQKAQQPAVVKFLEGKLNPKKTKRDTMARAALALGRLKSPSSIRPLIRVLTTEETVQLPGSGGSGQMSGGLTKGPGGTGGSSFTAGAPKAIKVQRENPEVLNALIAITGQNFGFDKSTWDRWYAAQKKKPETFDPRRN